MRRKIVTALPLVWFTAAARRLPLSTVGLLQYLAPTGRMHVGAGPAELPGRFTSALSRSGEFLAAVFLFDETFSSGRLVAFALIWAGLAVFTVDLVRVGRSARSRPA